MLTVPVTFPPEDVPNGELLSGLPLPDIRGTMGTFYYFGTDLSRYEEGNTEFGGILKRLVFDGDTRADRARRPAESDRQAAARGDLRAKGAALERRRQGAARRARGARGRPAAGHDPLEQGRRSRRRSTSATARSTSPSTSGASGSTSTSTSTCWSASTAWRSCYLIGAGQELQLYISPVNWRPDNPPAPMSSPASLSADLYERLGTVPHARLGRSDLAAQRRPHRREDFMDDLYRAFDDRAQVILQRIDAKQWDLLVGVIESTDRVQHMMWRLIDPTHPMYDKALAAKYGDSIERVYRRVRRVRRRGHGARRRRARRS